MKVEQCRACAGRGLQPFLDLGCTALANRFVHPAEVAGVEPRFPLRLALCGRCGLVQIDEEVPPDLLFTNYIYVTGTSDLIHAHAAALAARLVGRYELKRGSLVLEAGSNDGTVLRALRKYGLKTIGIEPAANLAEQANRNGIETLHHFFTAGTAERIRDGYGPAQLLLARHVLAHVADLHDFLRGFGAVLADDGLAVVEMPHILPFYRNLEYDTIYHEHRCYFSLRVLKRLCERSGLEVIDVEEVALHGGSLIVTLQRRGGPRWTSSAVPQLLAREERAGLHRLEPWLAFARRVARSKEALLDEVQRLRAAGRSLAGYGAPAKGMSLLAYCGLGPEHLPYLVDKNPFKQGLLTPGHHIPVFAPEKLRHDPPDVLLLLAWNFAAEIVTQQAEHQQRGGQWLLPIPVAHYWNRGAASPRPRRAVSNG